MQLFILLITFKIVSYTFKLQSSYHLLNKLPNPPKLPGKDFVMLSGVMLLSLGSFALCANFCNMPGKAPAIAISPVFKIHYPKFISRFISDYSGETWKPPNAL